MQVILLEKVVNLGKLGEQVKVRPGYARNFLFPQGKASAATPENLKLFEARRAELESASKEILDQANQRKDALIALGEIRVKAPSGDEGKLFGSVGSADIAAALTGAGVKLEKREVRLPEGSIRQTGQYSVTIHLHTDVNVDIKLVVEAE